MFGFRQQNRKRQPLGQRVQSAGEHITGMGRKILPVVFLVAVGIGVPFGIFHAYLRTVSGAYFELSKITVSGLVHSERGPLLKKAGLVAGRNIFNIDLERADAALELNPWVKSATVERRLPDQVFVHLREYKPAAIVIDGRYYLVSQKGVVFHSMRPGESVDAMLALPMISGLEIAAHEITAHKMPAGKASPNQDLLLEAITVAQLYAEMGLGSWEPISEIHIDPTLGLTLVTADTGVEIRLGRGRYRERLERLKVVQHSIVERAMQVDYILIDQKSDLSRIAVGRRHGPRRGSREQKKGE